MPVLEIHSLGKLPEGAVGRVRDAVAEQLKIPTNSVWILTNGFSADALVTAPQPVPIVFFNLRSSHAEDRLKRAVRALQQSLAHDLSIGANEVFVIVRPVAAEHVHSPLNVKPPISIQAIGEVENERKDVIDDDWGSIESRIRLKPEALESDCAEGLDQFSHVEVVFFMDRVDDSKIVTGARHPRNNPEWPKVGILAQRGKNRPNKIGVTRCELLSVDGLSLTVRGLDAVDGTPVLDVKPVMREFEVAAPVRQPAWSHDIMKNYF